MEILNQLMNFFGIESLNEIENFAQFVPWFAKLLLAVVIVGVVIRAMFTAVWKLERGLR